MRKIAIAAFSAALLSSVSVYAQTTSSPTTPGARMPGAGATPPVAAAPRLVPNPLKQEIVSNIEGTTVYGKDDAKLGHVSEVLMEPGSKKIDRLVVKTGAVLGLGGHQFAVPVDQFSWEADKGVLKISMDEAAAKSQPEWVEGAHTGTGSSTPPAGETPPTHAGDSQAPAH